MSRKQYNQIKGNGEMEQHNYIHSRVSHSRGKAFKKIKLQRKSVFERVFGNLFR